MITLQELRTKERATAQAELWAEARGLSLVAEPGLTTGSGPREAFQEGTLSLSLQHEPLCSIGGCDGATVLRVQGKARPAKAVCWISTFSSKGVTDQRVQRSVYPL